MIYSLGGYNRNKPTPGDHESNFRKVGAIPCEQSETKIISHFGCTNNILVDSIHIVLEQDRNCIKFLKGLPPTLLSYRKPPTK